KNLKLELKKHFKPEFLNRLDETIIFNTLSLDNIKYIADIQIDILKERLKERNIEINITPRGREFISEKGFSPEYGARPLKREIQKLLINPLSVKIIQNEFKDGDKITIDVKNRLFVFNKINK
ncbi:MAG: hypothetical protein KAJ79_07890, partial [Candidatus Omnitrophica bacterium]|nr:hypothetical protein [Candidatus Omnitrophota bacterium]